MRPAAVTKLIRLLKGGASGAGISSGQCHQMLEDLKEENDPSKPPLTNDYPKRCKHCKVAVVHKNNTSGFCTEYAVTLRCNDNYPSTIKG
jgi:hypothetical protein